MPGFIHPSVGAPEGALPTERAIVIPPIRTFVRHVIPGLLEGVIAPAAIFYLALLAGGFLGALLAAFSWSLLALLRRLVFRQRVPGMLWLSVVALGARTAIGIVTKSAFIYFMQPTISTIAIGITFAASAAFGRPVIERLALDFCPLPDELLVRPGMRRFFLRLSLLWSAVMIANGGVVLGLLVTSSLRSFVVERTVVSWGLSLVAVACSIYAFSRTLAREGVRLRVRAAKE